MVSLTQPVSGADGSELLLRVLRVHQGKSLIYVIEDGSGRLLIEVARGGTLDVMADYFLPQPCD